MIHRQVAETIVTKLTRRVLSDAAEEGEGDRNPWRFNAGIDERQDDPQIRRNNLLSFLDVRHVTLFLIADFGLDADVGHTGIPMVSPSCLVNGRIPRTTVGSLPSGTKAFRESVAINEIWKALYEHGIDGSTIPWNLYPFVSTSRRQPSQQLIESHASLIEPLLALHPRAQIIATNPSAGQALRSAIPDVSDRVIELKAQRGGVAAELTPVLRSLHVVA